ncbi:winged helix-turn-helix domain-containing protein [Nitrosopumilus sp.]|uniref:winged helix-turn-helix domain-containing protein n=1 Tax=Nitrosopumilus sp. TaxID=2024843 RepID=UPI00292CD421|nr:winged helix-turn-helix domain-containing protein [Nitrosopumilus sp.]
MDQSFVLSFYEIFNDILSGIDSESANGEVKPTRVAHIANMSYDKLSRYLEELNKKWNYFYILFNIINIPLRFSLVICGTIKYQNEVS